MWCPNINLEVYKSISVLVKGPEDVVTKLLGIAGREKQFVHVDKFSDKKETF